MVFSNLQPHEKDAFFNLLDEYVLYLPSLNLCYIVGVPIRAAHKHAF